MHLQPLDLQARLSRGVGLARVRVLTARVRRGRSFILGWLVGLGLGGEGVVVITSCWLGLDGIKKEGED